MPRKVSKSTVSTKYTLTRLWYDSYRIAIDYINAFMYKFTMYFTVKFLHIKLASIIKLAFKVILGVN